MKVIFSYLPIPIKMWGVNRGEYYACADSAAFLVSHRYQRKIMNSSKEALTDCQIQYSFLSNSLWRKKKKSWSYLDTFYWAKPCNFITNKDSPQFTFWGRRIIWYNTLFLFLFIFWLWQQILFVGKGSYSRYMESYISLISDMILSSSDETWTYATKTKISNTK